MFDIKVSDNLKLAADASNLERASHRIGLAIDYLDSHHIDRGHSHLIIPRPSNDVGYWYQNIKGAKIKADNAIKDGVGNEGRDLILLQIRKTLVDSDEHVTQPVLVELCPNQQLIMLGVFTLPFLPLLNMITLQSRHRKKK